MARHRLFVAAVPPAVARAALVDAMGGVPGARWQSDAQLHLTLRFVGEVDRHQAEDIAVALGQVRHPPIEVAFGASGTFDRHGRIDTLWIGIQPRDRIRPLHDKVDRALRQAGVASDPRAFLPHVTLARFARAAAPGPEVAGRIAISPLAFTLDRFALFESRLGSEGATYDAIEHYALRG